MPQDHHVQVHRQIVPHQASAPARVHRVAFNRKNRHWLVFKARGVVDRDQELSRIKMYGHQWRTACATNAKITKKRLLAGKSLLSGHDIPLGAFLDHGLHNRLPDRLGKRNRSFAIGFVFERLTFFGELGRQVLLRRALRAFVSHRCHFSVNLFYTIAGERDGTLPAAAEFIRLLRSAWQITAACGVIRYWDQLVWLAGWSQWVDATLRSTPTCIENIG